MLNIISYNVKYFNYIKIIAILLINYKNNALKCYKLFKV